MLSDNSRPHIDAYETCVFSDVRVNTCTRAIGSYESRFFLDDIPNMPANRYGKTSVIGSPVPFIEVDATN